MENGTENTDQVFAEIVCGEETHLVGGLFLMKVDSAKCSLMEIFNMGPEPITLTIGKTITQAYSINGQTLLPFEANQMNAFEEKQFT
jgi:hypothetical protein